MYEELSRFFVTNSSFPKHWVYLSLLRVSSGIPVIYGAAFGTPVNSGIQNTNW